MQMWQVFWGLKRYMFQRRSLAQKLLVVNLFSIGTFGGLDPPPPNTETAGYATAGASCSMIQRCQVLLFCSILYCFLMKILQDLGKYCFSLSLFTTQVLHNGWKYCFLIQNTVFTPENTAYVFARLASLMIVSNWRFHKSSWEGLPWTIGIVIVYLV